MKTAKVDIPQHTLIAYKRDKKRNPIGVVVATKDSFTGHVNYGFSLCRKGDKFTKARALEIAIGRSKFNDYDMICTIHSLRDVLTRIENRAKKYFRPIPF